MDESELAVIGVAGAASVELQGEMFREAQHGGVWVRVVVERVALCESAERAEVGRELLVACLVGANVRRFSLALARVWGLIWLVVGVDIVVFAHRCATMTANPATLQFLISPQSITNKTNSPPRSGLVQQYASSNGHKLYNLFSFTILWSP